MRRGMARAGEGAPPPWVAQQAGRRASPHYAGARPPSIAHEDAVKSIDFSFPAGLIPLLLSQSGGEPLRRHDIVRERLKRESEAGAADSEGGEAVTQKLREFYGALSSRLSKRFAEDGAALAKAAQGEQRGPSEERAPPTQSAAAVPPLVGERAGLGMKAEAADVYAAFRASRSSSYHHMIKSAKGVAKSKRRRGAGGNQQARGGRQHG